MLTAAHARRVVGVQRLARTVAAGRVRNALVGATCGPRSLGSRDGLLARGALDPGARVDVSRAAGQPHLGLVYAFSG
jgi:hypothetical protein